MKIFNNKLRNLCSRASDIKSSAFCMTKQISKRIKGKNIMTQHNKRLRKRKNISNFFVSRPCHTDSLFVIYCQTKTRERGPGEGANVLFQNDNECIW